MDPDEALRQLRASIAAYRQVVFRGDTNRYDIQALADVVVSNFENLDGWLSNGGFIPNEWKQHG